MISKKIRKTVLSITLATSMAMPSMVSATYPTIDFSNLLEAITQNYQDMQNWAQERMMMMAEMDLQSALSSLGIDAQNNAMTNQMVRDGRRAQTIQNIEVMEWSVADSDACGTLASQIIEQKVKEKNNQTAEQKIAESRDKHNNFDQNQEQWRSAQEARLGDILSYCKAGSDSLTNTNCVNSGLIFGGVNSDTLSPEQSKSVEVMNEILISPISNFKKSTTYVKGTAERKALEIQEVRTEAFRDIARTSLNEVSKQFKSNGNLPSPFASLKKFDDERYGSEKWLKDIQNVDPNNKNAIYISEINRKMAVMTAFMVHMDIIRYRQQLRMEGMQAAMLSLELEPIVK